MGLIRFWLAKLMADFVLELVKRWHDDAEFRSQTGSVFSQISKAQSEKELADASTELQDHLFRL